MDLSMTILRLDVPPQLANSKSVRVVLVRFSDASGKLWSSFPQLL